MNLIALQLPIGIFLAAIIALATFFTGSLSRSGATGAFLLGSIIFGIGGFGWSILLLAFFISSTLLSRLSNGKKREIEANFSKGTRRDGFQVTANGAVAGVCVLLFPLLGGPAWLWAGFAGALAAANADTWATEIGILGKTKPRMITNCKPVEPGTSGGVSLSGFLAAFGGSLFIAFLAVVFKPDQVQNNLENNIILSLIVTVAGIAGSLVDSILGAGSQAMYFCDICKKETEKHPLHGCGNPTRHIRGLAWLNNDWVNLFCTLTGSITAALLAIFLISSPVSLSGEQGAEMTKLDFSSPVFAYNQPIPAKYSCDGQNISPTFSWTGIPADTRSLALIADDPDAPLGTFTHWVVYNLPASQSSLNEGIPAGILSTGGYQGFNSARQNAYMGPCPPAGRNHHYFFRLYALDLEPTLPEGLTADKLSNLIAGHVLASGEWMGTYQS